MNPPPPQGIGREWEWECEFKGNVKHTTIPGPFANAIHRMAKRMTTAEEDCKDLLPLMLSLSGTTESTK